MGEVSSDRVTLSCPLINFLCQSKSHECSMNCSECTFIQACALCFQFEVWRQLPLHSELQAAADYVDHLGRYGTVGEM